MKSSLIASFVAISVLATPALATTTSHAQKVTKEDKQAKKAQKHAQKTAMKTSKAAEKKPS